MDFSDDIFREFDDRNEKSERFLGLLKERLPDWHFLLVPDDGRTISAGEPPSLSDEIRECLIKGAKDRKGTVYSQPPDGLGIHAIQIEDLSAVLIFILPGQVPDQTVEKYGLTIIQLGFELFVSQRNVSHDRELLSIQKEQLNRKVRVLEKKYLDILEDNQRGHQIIQKQQIEYSKTLASEIARQTAELRKANEQLRQNSRLQQKILDIAATAIFMVDPNQFITTVNEAFCFITGYERNDVIGKHCDILKSGQCANGCPLFNSNRTEPILGERCTIHRRDGQEVIVIKNASTIYDEDSRLIGGVESFVDVTDLIRARETAESANRAKSEFLANMSHEIRTPMNAVLGFVNMLLDTKMDEIQNDYACTIKKSGESLLSLLNDILDFSKIEVGEMDFEEIDFNPGLVAFDVCKLIGSKIGTKPIEIVCHVAKNMPSALKGDPVRFQQVLTNLMGNACKFTESGEIEISLDIEEEKDGRVKLHTAVQDTGIGIPKNKLSAIFEAFQQADGSTTRQYGGTGLGLSICRKISEHLNGAVWAESPADYGLDNRKSSVVKGPGSVFHFTGWFGKAQGGEKFIPESVAGKKVLVVDHNRSNLEMMAHVLKSVDMKVNLPTHHPSPTTPTQTDIRPSLEQENGHPVNILLVEDNPVNQKLVKMILTKAGYKVDVANNGREAVEKYTKTPLDFSLIFMDIQMPEMDGLEATKQIRKREEQYSARSERVPIVAMTANAMKGDREICLEAGMDDYIAKPIKRDLVFEILKKWIVEDVICIHF